MALNSSGSRPSNNRTPKRPLDELPRRLSLVIECVDEKSFHRWPPKADPPRKTREQDMPRVHSGASSCLYPHQMPCGLSVRVFLWMSVIGTKRTSANGRQMSANAQSGL